MLKDIEQETLIEVFVCLENNIFNPDSRLKQKSKRKASTYTEIQQISLRKSKKKLKKHIQIYWRIWHVTK